MNRTKPLHGPVATACTSQVGNSQPLSVHIYEPYIFGIYGNTRYLLDLFSKIDRSRYQLTLVAPYEHEILDRLRGLGGTVEVVPAPPELRQYGGKILSAGPWQRLKICRVWLQNCLALVTFLQRMRPTVIQCHSVRAIATIGVAAWITRVPTFWYVKGELANRVLDTLGFVLAQHVYFQSPRCRDAKYPLLRSVYKKKIGLLPNGIDLERLGAWTERDRQQVRKELGLSSREVNLICVGVISPLKGLHHIVEAILRIRERVPPFRLFLVGDPVFEKYESFQRYLKARVLEEGLSEQIRFLGWREDAPLIVSVMDILIHASLTEGVPKVVLEALAQGVPVIATDVGGTGDMVQNGHTGILIRPGAPEELAAAIERLCKDASLRRRLGASGRALVHEKYSLLQNIRSLEQIYELWRK